MKLDHRTAKTVTKGNPFPLGATISSDGVNFAIYSKHGAAVFLLLFDAPGAEPTDIIHLQEHDKFIWHASVKGLKAGQLYGYKVCGEYRPEWGLRFNEAKLLLDPYGRVLAETWQAADAMVASGLADHGWTYVNIDDCWEADDHDHPSTGSTHAHRRRLGRACTRHRAPADPVHRHVDHGSNPGCG